MACVNCQISEAVEFRTFRSINNQIYCNVCSKDYKELKITGIQGNCGNEKLHNPHRTGANGFRHPTFSYNGKRPYILDFCGGNHTPHSEIKNRISGGQTDYVYYIIPSEFTGYRDLLENHSLEFAQ